MYHKLVIFLGSISLQPFESYFRDYLLAIREAKDKGASHDYLRQVFIEFARKSFNVDPTDVELEKGIKGTKLRGSIDANSQKVESPMKISADKIFALTNQFQHQSQIYWATGGVHSAVRAECSYNIGEGSGVIR